MSSPFNRRVPIDPRTMFIDRYPRDADPNRPSVGRVTVRTTPMQSPRDPQTQVSMMADIFRNWRVRPSQRPLVYQRKLNISIPLTAVPVAIMNQTFPCDAFIINNPSTNASSIFWGDQSVQATNGMEIQPGLPVLLSTSNTRQLWEVQNALKDLAAIMAGRQGIDPPQEELSPRVVFDMNDQYLVSPAANQTVSVMFFFVPELQ